MADIALSFWALFTAIMVGFALARTGVVGPGADAGLSRLAFAACIPALMFLTVAGAEPSDVFSLGSAVNIAVAIILFVGYWIISGHFGVRGAERTIGCLVSSYINAGNIGIAYLIVVVGDPTQAAPVVMFQLCIVVPIVFTILDRQTGRTGMSVKKMILSPFLNPPVAAVFAGLVVSLTGVSLPQVVTRPIELIAQPTVPLLLISLGISAANAKLPRISREEAPMFAAVVARCAGGPLLSWGLGTAVGLSGTELLAVTIVGALPAANNVFVYAHRYGRAVPMARDGVLLTTFISLPVVLLIAALMH